MVDSKINLCDTCLVNNFPICLSYIPRPVFGDDISDIVVSCDNYVAADQNTR